MPGPVKSSQPQPATGVSVRMARMSVEAALAVCWLPVIRLRARSTVILEPIVRWKFLTIPTLPPMRLALPLMLNYSVYWARRTRQPLIARSTGPGVLMPTTRTAIPSWTSPGTGFSGISCTADRWCSTMEPWVVQLRLTLTLGCWSDQTPALCTFFAIAMAGKTGPFFRRSLQPIFLSADGMLCQRVMCMAWTSRRSSIPTTAIRMEP